MQITKIFGFLQENSHEKKEKHLAVDNVIDIALTISFLIIYSYFANI